MPPLYHGTDLSFSHALPPYLVQLHFTLFAPPLLRLIVFVFLACLGRVARTGPDRTGLKPEQKVDIEKLVRGILVEMRGDLLLIGEPTYHVSASGKLMTCIFPCDVEDAHLVLTR